jgi:hypothetical protein
MAKRKKVIKDDEVIEQNVATDNSEVKQEAAKDDSTGGVFVLKKMQSDNFIISRINDNNFEYIEVRSVSGNWSETFSNEMTMFHLLNEFLYWEEEHEELNKNQQDYMSAILGFHYAATCSIADETLLGDFIVIYSKYIDRVRSEEEKKESNNISKEEDDKILEELKESQRAKNELIDAVKYEFGE